MGTGNLVNTVKATQDTIYLAGGPFQVNDTITLEPYTPLSETFTINSIVNAPDAPEQMTTIQKVQLSAPLLNDHGAGSYLLNGTLGLRVIDGQDTYWLPLDWMDVEGNSFDIAFGLKTSAQRVNTFWSGADYTMLLSGASWGVASNYLATSTFFNLPIPIPFSTEGWPTPGIGMLLVTTYTFYDGPPHLVIDPMRLSGGDFQFDYFASHIPETIPDYRIEALVAYAAYTCYVARQGILAGQPSYKQDYRELFSHLSAAAMEKAAARALEDWCIRLAERPILYGG
jgi:hypothetical protein